MDIEGNVSSQNYLESSQFQHLIPQRSQQCDTGVTQTYSSMEQNSSAQRSPCTGCQFPFHMAAKTTNGGETHRFSQRGWNSWKFTCKDSTWTRISYRIRKLTQIKDLNANFNKNYKTRKCRYKSFWPCIRLSIFIFYTMWF